MMMKMTRQKLFYPRLKTCWLRGLFNDHWGGNDDKNNEKLYHCVTPWQQYNCTDYQVVLWSVGVCFTCFRWMFLILALIMMILGLTESRETETSAESLLRSDLIIEMEILATGDHSHQGTMLGSPLPTAATTVPHLEFVVLAEKIIKYYQTIATFYDRIKKIDTKSVSFIISGWMNGQCPLWHLGIVTIQMRNIYPRCTNDPPLCCCWQWGKRVPKKILRLLRYNSVFCWYLQPSNNSPLTLPFLPLFWLWTISHCQYSLCY